MSFATPTVLWGLSLVPLALILYVAAQRRRRQDAARFSNPALLPNLAPQAPGWRRHAPAALYLLALTALMIALARPQAMITVPQEQATIVLVMDTSVSMIATDVQPNRLAAARTAGQRFLDSLPTRFRVAVVSFSSVAQTLTGPTTDRQTGREALGSLRAEGARQWATPWSTPWRLSAPPAMGVAAGSATPSPSPSTPAPLRGPSCSSPTGQTRPGGRSPWTRRSGRAARRPRLHHRLGTAGGTIESPEAPGSDQRLAVPPDETTLRQIAEITGGRFFTAPTAADLRAVYDPSARA